MAEPLRDWRRRKPGEIERHHTEHTREVVKVEHSETLPEDVVRAVQLAGHGTLELQREVQELKAALEMIATANVDQLRAVLDRVEQVHRESVAADNELIGVLKGLAGEAKKASG